MRRGLRRLARAASAREATSRSGRPVRRATRTTSSCSAFTVPAVTFIRIKLAVERDRCRRTGPPATARTPSSGRRATRSSVRSTLRRRGVIGPGRRGPGRRSPGRPFFITTGDEPRVVGTGLEQRLRPRARAARRWRRRPSPRASRPVARHPPRGRRRRRSGDSPVPRRTGSPTVDRSGRRSPPGCSSGSSSSSRAPAPNPWAVTRIGGIGP